jgi:crotonobetainyl-CoA:carnitine CoA-transferase CaiB-like acyl-CoA transferase
MYAGKLLADLGADVLKVEPPAGSDQRRRGPYLAGQPDPEGSLFFWYHNTSKRGITLDLDRPADQTKLRDLARTADVLIEGFHPGHLAERGLGFTDLRRLNPRLIVTSITPFGQTGPYRDFHGDDVVAAAMGGLMYLCGMPESPPSQPGGAIGALSIMQADVIAGLGTLIALAARDRTGHGQQVDVSMQEAVAVATENALGMYSVMHTVRRRVGIQSWSGAGPSFRRCRDGWIFGGGGGARYDTLVDWLQADGLTVPSWLTREWWESTATYQRSAKVATLLETMYLRHSGEELFEMAQSRHIGLAPVRTADQVRLDPQLRVRGFWVDVDHPGMERGVAYPGAPYQLSRTPWRIARPAPHLGEHNGQAWSTGRDSSASPEKLAQRSDNGPDGPTNGAATVSPRLPLAGILIVDFSWQIAAPMVTKYLAAFGATVIKIEWSAHPDGIRTTPAPRPPGNLSVNASHIFANFSTNKLSLAVDMNRPEGRDLVRGLVAQADVVLDNFGIDPFPKWGFTYDELAKIKPDVIMLRSSVMGRTGPCSNYSGSGNTVGAATGLNTLMGFPDDPPAGTCTAHPDYSSNPHHSAIAILAALHYRNQTGLGQYIDLSQSESTAAFWGHALMENTINGRNPPRLGNRSPWAAPHGAYRCAPEGDDDDRWIAIACNDESEWQALARVLNSGWLDDPLFATLADRLENVAALDELVSQQVRLWDAYELMHHLQRAGVPAGVVQNHSDLLERDPQLRERGFFVWLDHLELGRIPHDGIPCVLSETPGVLAESAPLLGQHTAHVLREFLGRSVVEVADLLSSRVVEQVDLVGDEQ